MCENQIVGYRLIEEVRIKGLGMVLTQHLLSLVRERINRRIVVDNDQQVKQSRTMQSTKKKTAVHSIPPCGW